MIANKNTNELVNELNQDKNFEKMIITDMKIGDIYKERIKVCAYKLLISISFCRSATHIRTISRLYRQEMKINVIIDHYLSFWFFWSYMVVNHIYSC